MSNAKKNFKSTVFDGTPVVKEEPLKLTKYEELMTECWCIGGNRQKHTYADPRCAFYNTPKMLPPPRDSLPPENSKNIIMGTPPPQERKITAQTSMFQNQDDWRATPRRDKRPPCFCAGAIGELDREKGHLVGDPGCYVSRTSVQGIPPAGKSLKDNNPAGGFPLKQSEFKFDPPVTAEHEMLCAAYNKAMLRNPKDFSEMLDGYAMSLKCMKHIVAELHLMGWVCQQEEVPFGE